MQVFTMPTWQDDCQYSLALESNTPPRSCCEAGRAGNKAPTIFRGTPRPPPPQRLRGSAGGICPALPPTQPGTAPR